MHVFQERVITAMSELAASHIGETVLVVGHGGVLSAFFKHVLQLPLCTPRKFAVDNAGIGEMTWRPGKGWWVETWNSTRHLEDIGYVGFHHD